MRRLFVLALAVALVAGATILLALLLTPMQTVSAVGQTIRVGVAAPTASLSGPAELDLFGQRLPTSIEFFGPVRPRLELTQIAMSPELADAVKPGGSSDTAAELQQALVSGWIHYFVWEVVVVALIALLLLGAVAGWHRISGRQTLALLAVGLALTEAVNLGAIMTTAYTAPDQFRQVSSLHALVGATPTEVVSGPQLSTARDQVVVVGDSTAAGLGNPLLPDANDIDHVCGRSVDSFANALGQVGQWRVTNIACSGATIEAGLLGPQQAGSLAVPPQLPIAASSGARAIVINIGANDTRWSNLLQMCAAMQDCENNVLEAFFQQQLAVFTRDYLTLLTWLRSQPQLPKVVMNLYYNPFSGNTECLEAARLTSAKVSALVKRLDELNAVIADGAKAASFAVARPDFTDHGVCSPQPYVQGLDDSAPFHPTAAGGLAIALAADEALRNADPSA